MELFEWKEQLLPKKSTAEAIHSALGQWTELNVFCSDGAVAIDNNISEREIKRVVLNRKNSFFVGNPRGGRTATRCGPATLSHAAAGQPDLGTHERAIRMAARPVEAYSGRTAEEPGEPRCPHCVEPVVHVALTIVPELREFISNSENALTLFRPRTPPHDGDEQWPQWSPRTLP